MQFTLAPGQTHRTNRPVVTRTNHLNRVAVLFLLVLAVVGALLNVKGLASTTHQSPSLSVNQPGAKTLGNSTTPATVVNKEPAFSVSSVIGSSSDMVSSDNLQSSTYVAGRETGGASDEADSLFVPQTKANDHFTKLVPLAAPAAPFAPPNLTLTGTCDTFGNSLFTIKNIGGAMTTNYTWEIYQNNVFLTSGTFQLTAAGTSSDTQQLTINGLYGNIAVAIKKSTTPAAVEIVRVSAFCVERPTVTLKQAAGQADPTTLTPIKFDVTFSKAVTGFTNTDVKITGMTATPGITVTDSGNHIQFSIAVTGMADGETVVATIPQDAAQDADGNGNRISTYIIADHSVTYHAPPNLTLSGTCDGFGNSIFIIKNLGGAMTVNYTWEIYQNSVFLTSGTFLLTKAGTSSDTQQLTINGLYGNVAVAIKNGTTPAAVQIAITTAFCVDPTPSVTINHAATQANPTRLSPINFDVVFSAAVSGFINSDVQISGMAGTPVITLTDSGDHIHFSVAVTGMADGETVTATIPAGRAFIPGHPDITNKVSTSIDNHVTYDISRPTVTINQAAGQADPTDTSPIRFDIVFNEVITGFTSSDVDVQGMHATPGITLTDSGDHKHFNIAVTGMINGDHVNARIFANVVTDLAGNLNANSTFTDNTVLFADTTPPSVTVEQKSGQADPVSAGPIRFTATFSEPIDVTTFTNTRVTLSGTAGATTAVVSEIAPNDHTKFDISVTGMTTNGTVIASILANRIRDLAGNFNSASTSLDNTVTYDTAAPTVTINQAAGQADPANNSPINFQVVFNESVTDFDDHGDVTLSGTAGATTIQITGGPMIYNVAVSGMTSDGTVIASIPANAAKDAANNLSTASTSTDNTVTFKFCASNPIVTSTADSGPNTLREAISNSCGAPNNNISFNLGGPGANTILLTSGQLEIQRDVNIVNTINGANGPLIIDGNNSSRVFLNDAGVTTTIKGVTITNGNHNNLPSPGGSGSGLRNDGTLSLTNVVINGNHTAAQGDGGGIYNDGNLTITSSTISNNSGAAGSFGAGIENAGGSVSMTNCTVAGNTGADQGGGIRNSVGTFTIISSTIAGNSAINGGGIHNASGALNLRNSIIALNTVTTSGPDVFGSAISQGFNLIGNSTGATITPSVGDQVGTSSAQINPLLDILGGYGGPTPTLRLLPSSPAIDQGDSSSSTSDQRGLSRPVDDPAIINSGDGADIGAYEVQSVPTITPDGPTTFCTGGSVTLTSSSATGNQWFLNGNPINGETNPTYLATVSGDYRVEAGNVISATTTVTVNAIPAMPTITPGGPTTFCAGGGVTLTSSSVSGNQWYLDGNPIGGAINQDYNATASGDYTVVTTAPGCSSAASAAMTITVNPLPATPTITSLGPTTFCDGGSVTLTLSGGNGNQWYLNGNPIDGATDQAYIATTAGNYTVVTSDGCASAPSTPTSVTVNPTPAASAISPGGLTSFCDGGSVKLTSSSATGNQWYLDGNPIAGATSQAYIATVTGSYTDTVTGAGCMSVPSSSISVVANAIAPAPTIIPGGPTTFIDGGSVTLTSSSANGNQWYLNGSPIDGATNQTYIATVAGDYTLTIAESGCGSVPSVPITVTVLPNNLAYAEPTGVCGGSSPCFTTIQAAVTALGSSGTVNVIGGAFNDDVNLSANFIMNIDGDATINSLMLSGGTLNGSTGGSFTLTLASGDWTNKGGIFNADNGTVRFSGSGQSIGGANSTTFNNLKVGAGGAILNSLNPAPSSPSIITVDETVTGVLTLSGDLTVTDPAKLIMPASASSTGTGDVIGNLQRTGLMSGACANAPCPNTLSFGNPDNQITITDGTAPNSILVNLTKSAPATYAAAVQRNYTITQSGGSGFTATLRLHYLDAELNGNTPESNLNLRRFNGVSWSAVPGPRPVDTANNWVESNAVTDFSQWTFAALAPTASTGIISGRILGDNGSPIEGAVVRLSGAQTRKTITDANGNYHFSDVETTGFYTVTPSRVNYNLSPSTRSLSQLGNQTEAVFSASLTGDTNNPLDTPEYFVRQQYVDVLGREPDEGGFNFWSDRILLCGADTVCVRSRRIAVAAEFFIQQEFQASGAYLYNLYQGSLSRPPAFAEYAQDRQRVVGGPNLEAEKQAFAESFVQRAEFMQKYQTNSTAESFVDALLTNLRQATGVDLTSQRDNLIAHYNAGNSQTQSRSFVLRDVTENAITRVANYNAAFVLTEYFGYLRRDPDRGGYEFWLNVLNASVGGDSSDYHPMVCAFVTSTEYQRRFSSVVSHGNGECGK